MDSLNVLEKSLSFFYRMGDWTAQYFSFKMKHKPMLRSSGHAPCGLV